jgi:hypothetical protein
MGSSKDYHFLRAASERRNADLAKDGRAADAHLRLSALHLSRALVLDEVDRQFGSNMPFVRR